jgi:hypothetical protein
MKLKEQLSLQKDIEVPWHVWTKLGPCAKKISLAGDQASLTNEADYASLEDLRKAIEFYVDQLGGTVKWSK